MESSTETTKKTEQVYQNWLQDKSTSNEKAQQNALLMACLLQPGSSQDGQFRQHALASLTGMQAGSGQSYGQGMQSPSVPLLTAQKTPAKRTHSNSTPNGGVSPGQAKIDEGNDLENQAKKIRKRAQRISNEESRTNALKKAEEMEMLALACFDQALEL